MPRTRGRKIFREVMARKARTLLVATSIFIGVLGVVTLFTMGEILVDRLESTIDPNELAMIRAYISLNDTQPVDDAAVLAELEAMPEVESVQGMALRGMFWKPANSNQDMRLGTIFAYFDGFDAIALEPIELVDGRHPVAGNNEIAIERRLADAHDLSVGDALHIRTLGSGTTQIENWTVVGIIYQPYPYPTLPGTPSQIAARNMLFATFPDTEWIAGSPGLSMILVRHTDYASAGHYQGDIKRVIATSPYVAYVSVIEDPDHNPTIERTRTFSGVLALLAFLALAVSGFLVFNVINAMVIEQRRQIGMMKALGATAADNFAMYAGIALAYGAIGTVPGVLVGIPTGHYAAANLAHEFNIWLEGFRVSGTAIALGAAMGLLIPVLASILPVLFGIRVSILDAMTDQGIRATYRRGPLGRVVDVLPLSISGRQALRNILVKKGRLALTILTMAAAAGAFMGIFASMTAFNRMANDSFDAIGNHITVNPRGVRSYTELHGMIDQVDGIQAIEPAITLQIDIEGYTPQGIGLNPAFLVAFGINPENPNMAQFNLNSGTAWNNDPARPGVVISTSIAAGLNKEAGDDIVVWASGRSQTFEIIGVSTYAFDTVWFRWDELARLGGLIEGIPPANAYATLLSSDGLPVVAAGIDAVGADNFEYVDGGYDPAGVIITEGLAARGYGVGDLLPLESSVGSGEYLITGIIILPEGLSPIAEAVGMDWLALADLEGKSRDGAPRPNSIQVILADDNPTSDEIDLKIGAIRDVLQANGVSAGFVNWVASLEAITALLTLGSLVMNTAAALIGAVGAIGLLSTLSMSVFERQKEIGVMRSVGATSRTVAGQFLVEGLAVGFIAWLIGLPVSYGIYRMMVVAFGFGDVAGLRYPPDTVLRGLAATLLIATVASLWPSLAAARRTVSDILRYR